MAKHRVFLLKPGADAPFRHATPEQAVDLVLSGKATVIDHRSVRMTSYEPPVLREIAPSSGFMPQSGQGNVYEMFAATIARQLFAGGLVRTETRPAPITRFQNARVGHQ